MEFQDYYTTLGVSRSATADEIKKAYGKAAKEWHPDKHPADKRAEVERKFAAISEANEVLSDPEKRKRYDALGENWRHGQEFRPPPGGGVSIERVLAAMGLPTAAPELAPARGPPTQADLPW